MQDLHARLARYDRFYASRGPGALLVVNRVGWPSAPKDLTDYDFERGGHLDLARDVVEAARRMSREADGAGEDFIPFVYADLGIAVHHAFLVDVPIRFAEWTSWAPHPLEGPDGYARLDTLRFDPANRWATRVSEMVAYFREHAGGDFLFNTHLHYSPLDLANAIRGNDLFTDFYDYPDEVRRLLEICTDAMIRFEEHLRAIAGPAATDRGTPLWGALAPRGSVYMSEDVMDMIGPALAEKWGAPFSSRVVKRLGGAVVHHHAMGLAVQGVIARMLPGFARAKPGFAEAAPGALIQISTDPNYPPPVESVAKLYDASGGSPLMLDVTPEQIARHIAELKRGRAILITRAADPDERKRLLDLVRSNSTVA